jgi:hypothetical protein
MRKSLRISLIQADATAFPSPAISVKEIPQGISTIIPNSSFNSDLSQRDKSE